MFLFGIHLVETGYVILDIFGIDYFLYLHPFVIVGYAKFKTELPKAT